MSNFLHYKRITVYRHNVICLSEIYLDNSVLSGKSDLDFLGYKWLGLTIQEMLKEDEYVFALKSPYLYVF